MIYMSERDRVLESAHRDTLNDGHAQEGLRHATVPAPDFHNDEGMYFQGHPNVMAFCVDRDLTTHFSSSCTEIKTVKKRTTSKQMS